jgi:aspartate/methionine/tyrosine aminotransferase
MFLLKAHPRLMIVSDEVYEWLTYDGAEHIRLATLPGMWDRTLTVSSAGKTFSATGWKTGWIIGPGPAIQSIMRAHQFIVFCIATPLQHAIATAITEAEKINFFSELRQKYLKKRDFMLSALEEAGLNPIVPQGSFFIVSDISDIKLEDHEGRENLTGLCMDVHDWRVSRFVGFSARY